MAHRTALHEHGPCDIYRMTYAPVKVAAERQENLASISLSLNGSIKKQVKTKKVQKSSINVIKKHKIERKKSALEKKEVGSLVIKKEVVKIIPVRRSDRLKLIA